MAESGERITESNYHARYIKFKNDLSRKMNGVSEESDKNVQRQLELLETWETWVKQSGTIADVGTVHNEFKDDTAISIILGYLVNLHNQRKSDDGDETDPADPSSENFSTPKSKGGRGSWDDEQNIKSVEGARKDLVSDYAQPSNGVMSSVHLLIEGIRDIVQRKRILAPFLFQCQSSGYGKTRGMLDLSRQRRSVYLPCKVLPAISGQGTAWKVPTALNKVLESVHYLTLNDIEIIEHYWIKFIRAVKKAAAKYDSAMKLLGAQVTEDGKQGHFYTELKTEYEKLESPSQDHPRPKPAFRRSPIGKKGSVTFPDDPIHRREEIDYRHAIEIDDNSLVICVDEASRLFDVDSKTNISFKAFRRAAKQEGVIIVFSDTSATISEIMHYNDSSTTANGGAIGELLAPIIRIPNFDMKWSESSDLNNLENLFVAGRPRWFSILEEEAKKRNPSNAVDGHRTDAVEALVDTVKRILTRTAAIDPDDEQKLKAVSVDIAIDPALIAVFSCRFSIGPQSKLSPLLAKYSLATVTGVSLDRKFVRTNFPSEPVLAEASAQYTQDHRNLIAVLDNFNAALKSSIIEPPRGDVGEMCGAALLGLTMDDIRKGMGCKMFSEQSVSLGVFLSRFGCMVEEEPIKSALQGWEVNFTHFVRCPTNMDHSDLPLMFMRRMAYYVGRGLKGLDLLLAMHHEEKGYASVRVQIKNRAKFEISKRDIALDKLKPHYCPPKVPEEKFSVGLLLCSEVDPLFQLSDYDDKNRIVFPEPQRSSKRLKSPDGSPERLFLSVASTFDQKISSNTEFQEIIDKLKEICNAFPEIDDWDPSRDSIEEKRNLLESNRKQAWNHSVSHQMTGY